MRWFYGLKVRDKLFLAFGLVIILSAGMSVYGIRRTDAVVERYNSLITETMARRDFIAAAYDAYMEILLDTTLRIILTEHVGHNNLPYFVLDFDRLNDIFHESMTNYRQLLIFDQRMSDEEIALRLGYLDSVDERYSELAGFVFEIDRAIEIGDGPAVSEAFMMSVEIAREVMFTLQDLAGFVSDRASYETLEVTEYARAATNAIIAVTVVIALLTVGFLLFFAGIIRRPIEQLQFATAQISAGNLDYRIRSDSKDEIGQLSNDIADMVDSISDMNKTVTIMEHLDTMICVVSRNFDIVYMNESMKQAYGFDKVPLGELKCYELLKNLDRPCHFCHIAHSPSEESEHFEFYESGSYYDERLGIWIEMRSTIIRWIDGSLVQFHSLTDVTERKNNQDKQAMYEEQLKEAAAAAQVASIAKSSFIANVSHEIRTPMNSIVGYSELALDDDDMSAKTHEYLRRILDNSRLLLLIINNILDISKIESGNLELESAPFDINEVFSHCNTTIMPLAQEKNILLHFYAEPMVDKMLVGDSTRLTQVLINLMTNGVKFTHSGMVKASCVVEARTDNSYTLGFEIRDSGIGMSKEDIDKIFRPFVQADASYTRIYGGSGLGLPITKSLVEAMGGELKVDSVLKVGSIFSFSITFEAVDAPPNKHRGETVLGYIAKPLFVGEVLVCEDNVMNQGVITEHLEKVGLTPVIAQNGLDGVEMVRQRQNAGEKPFGLIFMDIHMPVMDGLEAASIIKGLGTETPIVAMTANVMINDQEAYRVSGMKETVSKPFTSQVLWRCLLRYFTPLDWQNGNAARLKEEEERFELKLLKQFIANNRNVCGDIDTAIASGDIPQAFRLAHNLKGHAGIIKKPGLQWAAEEVEAGLRNRVNKLKENDLANLREQLENAMREIMAVISGKDNTEATEEVRFVNMETLRECIGKLEELLADGNIKYLDYVDRLRALPDSEELIHHMENIDAAKAAELLAEMKAKWM